jgi:hypothetical protein
MRRTLWRAGLLLTLAGCATARPASPGAPGYVRVHFDHVDPAKLAQFVEARETWLATIRREKAPDPWWGSFFEVEGAGFMALRPFGAFAELDRPPPPEPDTPEHAAAAARYDQMADSSLVFPHASQIWTPIEELSYQPASGPIPLYDSTCYGAVTFEGLAPTRAGEYEAGWQAILAALKGANYPLARFAFGSRYGDGRRTSIWVASSEPAFRQALPWEKALEQAVGPERAATLRKAIADPVVTSETFTLRGRPDLSTWPDALGR